MKEEVGGERRENAKPNGKLPTSNKQDKLF